MGILKSILFGSEGCYESKIANISFEKLDRPGYSLIEGAKGSNFFHNCVCYLAEKCLTSKAFILATQGYLHTLVHELGHAGTYKYFTTHAPNVTIITNHCSGFTSYFPRFYRSASPIKKTIMNIGGPMSNMIFSSTKLIAAAALKDYISWPVALVLGTGSVVWMSGELLYAFTSAYKQDQGDFGCIAERSKVHLVISAAALIGQYALGILGTAALLT